MLQKHVRGISYEESRNKSTGFLFSLTIFIKEVLFVIYWWFGVVIEWILIPRIALLVPTPLPILRRPPPKWTILLALLTTATAAILRHPYGLLLFQGRKLQLLACSSLFGYLSLFGWLFCSLMLRFVIFVRWRQFLYAVSLGVYGIHSWEK